MIIYVYGKCSTCKQALRFLEQHCIKVMVREITSQPPSIQELQLMLDYQKGNVKKLFNTSGELYRNMNLSQKLDQLSVNEALHLLNQNGMIVKRPFLIGKELGLVGFKEGEWTEVLHFKNGSLEGISSKISIDSEENESKTQVFKKFKCNRL
jgi:arsenate reductase